MIWLEGWPPHARGPVEEREFGCPGCGHCWYADGRRAIPNWPGVCSSVILRSCAAGLAS